MVIFDVRVNETNDDMIIDIEGNNNMNIEIVS